MSITDQIGAFLNSKINSIKNAYTNASNNAQQVADNPNSFIHQFNNNPIVSGINNSPILNFPSQMAKTGTQALIDYGLRAGKDIGTGLANGVSALPAIGSSLYQQATNLGNQQKFNQANQQFNEAYGKGIQGQMQAGQGVFNLTPTGVGFNLGFGGISGELNALRNGATSPTDVLKGVMKGFGSNMTVSQGAGIKDPLLAQAVDLASTLVVPAVMEKAVKGANFAIKVNKIDPESSVRISPDSTEQVPVKSLIKWVRGEFTGGNLNDPQVKQVETFLNKNPEYAVASIKADQGAFVNFGAKVGGEPTPQGLDALAQEARKYKSAEEFVKAQPTLYHGTTSTVDIPTTNFASPTGKYGKGIYLSENPPVSGRGYGTQTKELVLDPKANIIELKGKEYSTNPAFQAKKEGLLKALELYKENTGRNFSSDFHNPNFSTSAVAKSKVGDYTVEQMFWTQSSNKYINELKDLWVQDLRKQGVDGIRTHDGVVLFNDGLLKTKSQLTDIYNQSKVGVTGKARLNIKPQTISQDARFAKFNEGIVNPTPNIQEQVPQQAGVSGEQNIMPSGPSSLPNNTPGVKQRGVVTSVREAQGISKPTKAGVSGTYRVKPNEQLMGEAKALLTEGATIDFKNTQNLDQKVAATIQQAINLDKAGNHEAAAALYNNLSTHATELGRGVQAFSMIDKMSPEAVSLSAAGKIKQYNATATKKIPELTGEQQKFISNAVENIRGMVEGRDKNIAINELNNKINDFIPTHTADKIITVWKAGLLTSLRTHERNLLGNSIMSGFEAAKDLPATAADVLMSQKTGTRTLTPTLQGMGEFGSAKTRQQVADLVVKGYDPSAEISKFDTKRINWGKNPVEQALKAYTESVFRVLGAEDRPFWNSSFARSLYDQAGAEAINAGKGGDKAFIENLVKNPTEKMATTATADANYATFHDKSQLSGLANSLKRGMGEGWSKLPAEVVAPFTGVPSSIVGKTVAYSPIGLVRGAINVGRVMAGSVPELQRVAAQELGRGVMGTALFALGSYLMSKGLMTGQPKDTAEAQQWQLENKPSNSILIGGKWRNIGSIGPQNLVMLAGAKYNQEMSKPDGSIGAYAAGLGKDQLSQTFLAGVQQPLNALTDPARYGPSYVGNTASSVVPNIVKDASKAFDPTARETNTVVDYMKSGIPGIRNTLLPKRDVLGTPVPQEPTGIGAFTDVFNSKTPNADPVVTELGRLYNIDAKSAPSKLQKGQTILGQKVTLTPQQLDQLEQQTGQPIKEQFARLMQTPEYQNATDEVKSKALGNIVTGVREQAKLNVAQGTTGIVDSSKLTKQARLTLAKDSFDKSGANYQIVGDTVLRRDAQGNITATPKVKFDYQLGTAQMTQFKNNGDLKGWLTTAKKQLESIQTQLQDPAIDPLDSVQLQNDAQTIMSNIAKYSSYGGFTKPKKISVPKATFKPLAKKKTMLAKLNIKPIKSLGAKNSSLFPALKAPTQVSQATLNALRNPKL